MSIRAELARRYVWTANALTMAAAAAAFLMIAATILVINHMIVVRFLGMSVVWNMELAIYLTIGALFLGSPYAAKTKGHVAVELLETALPPRLALVWRVIVHVIVLVVCGYLTIATGQYTWHAYAIDLRSTSLWAPQLWPVYAAMPVGLFLTAVQVVAEIIILTMPERTERAL